MSAEELTLLARWSGDLTALLEAGVQCDAVAAALLHLIPGAVAAQCQLDGRTAHAGPAAENFVTAEVEAAGRPRGRLAVALVGQEKGRVSVLLSLAAQLVALRLPPNPDEQRQMMELVTVGEAAGWVVHALNNHLNGMVLQAACVQMQTQPPVRDQAEHIRREGARAATRLRPLQTVRPWPMREGEQVDLIAAVQDVLSTEADLTRLRVELPSEKLLVSASRMGIRRMLTLLFRVVLRCVNEKESAELRVARSEGVVLTLDLPGVECPNKEEGLEGLTPAPEGGLHQLEREAARWLVRQMGGRLQVRPGDRKVTLTIEWEPT